MASNLDMGTMTLPSTGKSNFIPSPSYLIEYGYYATIFYSMLGVALGVSIPLVGAGLLAALASISILHFGRFSGIVFAPIALALLCGISILLLQIILHEESIRDPTVKAFITWLLSLVVVQSLCFRKGFLHRFALMAFFVGCCTLPFLKVYVDVEELTRIGTTGTGLANPNAFSMWFGFCAVYFMVLGLQTRNTLIRIAAWTAGVFCLYLVGITVSRGNLLGVFLACAFAFKKMLRRSFFPIIILLFSLWLIYISGLVDNIINYYIERAGDETGRSFLWSVSLRMFFDAWWAGSGFSNSVIILPGSGYETNSHNGLLFIAMTSGVLPLLLFGGYLLCAARGAFRADSSSTPYAPYLLPLFIFSILSVMLSATVFMSPWNLVVLSACASVGIGKSEKKPQ